MSDDKRLQVNVRLTPEDYELFQTAARLEKRSLSGFVQNASWLHAVNVIRDYVPSMHGAMREELLKRLTPEDEAALVKHFAQRQQEVETFLKSVEERKKV